MDEPQELPHGPVDRRRDRRPRHGGRRIRDDLILGPAFDRVLLSISDQVYSLQGRKGSTVQQVADGAGVSVRAIFDIFKLASDPKISTLVRLAHYYESEVVIAIRPRSRPRPAAHCTRTPEVVPNLRP